MIVSWRQQVKDFKDTVGNSMSAYIANTVRNVVDVRKEFWDKISKAIPSLREDVKALKYERAHQLIAIGQDHELDYVSEINEWDVLAANNEYRHIAANILRNMFNHPPEIKTQIEKKNSSEIVIVGSGIGEVKLKCFSGIPHFFAADIIEIAGLKYEEIESKLVYPVENGFIELSEAYRILAASKKKETLEQWFNKKVVPLSYFKWNQDEEYVPSIFKYILNF